METVERRKACDTCSRKKIKCDMLQPSCSNCQMYRTECKMTTPASTGTPRRRLAGSKRSLPQAEGAVAADDNAARVDTLEYRIGTIETQLQAFHQTVSVSAAQGHQVTARSHCSSEAHGPASAPLLVFQGTAGSVISSTLSSRIEDASGTSVPPYLPPLEDILPVVERFFEHTNTLIPLFDKGEFLCLLMDWFTPSSAAASSYSPNYSYGLGASRDALNGDGTRRTVFAAINVVLALSHRIAQEPSQAFDLTTDDPMVEQYMRNVEQLMQGLVSQAESLVALQVLLGMLLLYIGSRDEQPATVWIGSAVQLCNRLRLNHREENLKYPASIKLQRERVFWITYILDKDISQRYHTPSLLVDDDIDLDWPNDQPSADGVGDICTETPQGLVRFSFFATRVALATIQGQTYDQLYSNRASQPARVSPQQRQARVYLLDARLESWRRTIPCALQAENVVVTLGAEPLIMGVSDRNRGALVHMAEMHFMYMACLVRIHGLWSHDAEWQRLLSGFGQQAVKFAGLPGNRCTHQRPLAPKQWEKCVRLGRDCLRLVQNMPLTTRNIWSTGCAYISSLVIILANLFQCDNLQQLEADQALTRQGLFIFSKLKDASSWQPLHRLHGVVRELDRRATDEIDMKRARMSGGAPLAPPSPPPPTDEDIAATMTGMTGMPALMLGQIPTAQTLVPDVDTTSLQTSHPDVWAFRT